MDPAQVLPTALGGAVLLPLLSFFLILIAGPKMGVAGRNAGYVAASAIGFASVLSFFCLIVVWLPNHWPGAVSHDVEQHAAADFTVRGQDGQSATEADSHGSDSSHATESSAESHAEHADEHGQVPPAYSGEFNVPILGSPWVLGSFGDLRLSISYYIDALTVCMFCMVTFIATLIHIYAMGYMHDELEDYDDHEVTMADGQHLHRPGRYSRFFQSMSLFCFSMLGLVLAGNIAMVFVFWELVGICSYFLIGFYVERQSASNAANKAFIVNRVGDFGMIIGLMALWTGLGTFSFGDIEFADDDGQLVAQQGIFSLVRPAENHHALQTPDGMVLLSARDQVAEVVSELGSTASREQIDEALALRIPKWRDGTDGGRRMGYGLLIVAGIGIFAGCVGKSAQFPLHTWLPDAMEGPTPVSALVHSATMVAAGVYLVARFYPVFTPEVLLVIAVTGCVTLFMAATIAITATDIKRVLAYSTISQLGYMMMALGVGAWLAGVMHLITHAFFKSLLFMCSGSVIHAVHTNEMPEMGGLRKKMPVTAYTMLIGCMAIAGAGVPFILGFLGQPLVGLGLSGFYSKDAILEQAFSFMNVNPSLGGVFFLAAAGGAAVTAFYMFRLWYLTFAGEPRDRDRYDHAHESPSTMFVPLIILSVMAIAVAWNWLQGLLGGLIVAVVFFLMRRRSVPASDSTSHEHDGHGGGLPSWLPNLPWVLGSGVFLVALICLSLTPGAIGDRLSTGMLASLLEQARPAGTLPSAQGVLLSAWTWPNEHDAHAASIVAPASLIAIGTALAGFCLATLMYGIKRLDPDEVRRQFDPLYRFLLNKWWFDELYDWIFVRPTHVVARFASGFDRSWIDWFVDGLASVTKTVATLWERFADQTIVDGFVNSLARRTFATGVALRAVQTGRIRQYVMFIVIGAVAIFVLVSFFWTPTLAG
jgi:NADH:ubiquinone oxidoreductase subunit 5 (subunit L)/multisubunit Na+/H+ antiporter MnhA subunit